MNKDFEKIEEPHRKNLFSIKKLHYARGERPNVDCILCSIEKKDSKVPNLTIIESKLSILSVNLYPYNPGHLIVFPKRHILNYPDMTNDESIDIHTLTSQAIELLNEAWKPPGFNLGYNLGKYAGGSIPHIHQHIVPRFRNEAGYLDVLANTRVVIYDPYEMLNELKNLWNKKFKE